MSELQKFYVDERSLKRTSDDCGDTYYIVHTDGQVAELQERLARSEAALGSPVAWRRKAKFDDSWIWHMFPDKPERNAFPEHDWLPVYGLAAADGKQQDEPEHRYELHGFDGTGEDCPACNQRHGGEA